MSIHVPKTHQAKRWLAEAKDDGRVMLTLPIEGTAGDMLEVDLTPDQATDLAFGLSMCAATARTRKP